MRSAIIRASRPGSIARSAATLISGTVASQAIVFMLSPLLSRVFDPTAFGELANYNAWISILGLLSNLRYEQALIVAVGRVGINRVIALALSLSMASFAIYSIAALVAWVFMPHLPYVREIRGILPLIPAGVIPTVFVSLLMQLNTRKGRFKAIAVISVVQALVTLVLQVCLGLARVPHALVLGVLFGTLLTAALYIVAYLRGNFVRHVTREIRWRELRGTALLHANFPRYALGADVLAAIVQQFVPVFLTGMFGPAVAGLYAFATRVIRVPMIVISTSVAAVLRKQAGDHIRREGTVGSLYRRILFGIGALSIAPFVTIGLFASSIFALVFGSQWREAGMVAQILSPGMALEFIAMPLLVFFTVTNNQRYAFRVQVANGLGLMAALSLGYTLHSFIATCALTAASMVIVNGTAIVMGYRVAQRPIDPRLVTVNS